MDTNYLVHRDLSPQKQPQYRPSHFVLHVNNCHYAKRQILHIRKAERPMRVPIELSGKNRKELAQAISEIVDAEVVYKGGKSHAYVVGEVVIDMFGELIVPDDIDGEWLRTLLADLRERGFGADFVFMSEPEAEVSPAPATEEPEPSPSLVIQLPIEGFTSTTLENLRLLVASKATLIKKALGVCDLIIRTTDDTVDFPWFDETPAPAEVTAYTHFLTLVADMAKRQTRVLAVEKPVENEKYAFRCFLLRLGMMGEEYADTRRILLRNLTGNGSLKSGEARPPKPKVVPVSEGEAALPLAMESAPPPVKGRFSLKKLLGGLKLMGLG